MIGFIQKRSKGELSGSNENEADIQDTPFNSGFAYMSKLTRLLSSFNICKLLSSENPPTSDFDMRCYCKVHTAGKYPILTAKMANQP